MIRIGLVLPPGFQAMSVAAMSAFELANARAENELYEITTLSERGGAISSSMGMSIDTQQFANPCFDTLLVSGVLEVGPATRGLIAFVRRSLPICRRIGSICTGAFFLAEAGVLDGKRATTHWQFAGELRDRFPKVKVEEDRIFIADGSVWTAAGMSAGLDLALGMIGHDFGAALARSVAQRLLIHHRRAGGQSQHSPLPALDAKSDRIQSTLDYVKRNLREDLTVERLANIARLGRRQFSRAFRAETGQSPAKAVERLRLEAARSLMEEGHHSAEVVAREAGFADRERMRRAFLRAFGQPPQAIRRNARTDA